MTMYWLLSSPVSLSLLLLRRRYDPLQIGTEVLCRVELRSFEQQVALGEEEGRHQPHVTDQGDCDMGDGLLLVVQACVDGHEDYPHHAVGQSGNGNVACHVVLPGGLQGHEGAHEGDECQRAVEAQGNAEAEQRRHRAAEELRHKVHLQLGDKAGQGGGLLDEPTAQSRLDPAARQNHQAAARTA